MFTTSTRLGRLAGFGRSVGGARRPHTDRSLAVEVLEDRLCLAARPFLLVTSYGNNSVMRYNEKSGTPAPARGETGATFVSPGSGGLTTPLTLIFAPDGSLIVDSGEDNNALRYDGRSGKYLNEFVEHNAGGLFIPTGLVFSADHTHFFLASNANNKILRFDYDGVSATNPITFVSDPDMGGPAGMVFGPDGHLYVSSLNNSKVLRYDGTTGAPLPARRQTGATFVPNGSGGLDRCGGVVFGPDGNIYVSSQNTNQLMRYNGKTGKPLPGPGQAGAVFTDAPGSGFDRPAGLLFGPGADGLNQDIYVVSINTETVVRVDGDTGDSLGAFITSGSGGLSKPRSLTFAATNPTTLAYEPGRTDSQGDVLHDFIGLGIATAGPRTDYAGASHFMEGSSDVGKEPAISDAIGVGIVLGNATLGACRVRTITATASPPTAVEWTCAVVTDLSCLSLTPAGSASPLTHVSYWTAAASTCH